MVQVNPAEARPGPQHGVRRSRQHHGQFCIYALVVLFPGVCGASSSAKLAQEKPNNTIDYKTRDKLLRQAI